VTYHYMSDEEYAKYMKAYNRGQHDANQDYGYEVAHEVTDLEKQGYSDGWMNTPHT
jgi:hypothetical protein